MSIESTIGEVALPPVSGSVALVHQFQPTPYTCVHACIAMVIGRPASEVVEEIGNPHGLNQQLLLRALEQYDLMHAMTLFGSLWTGWQFAVVPSLNNRGGAHQVLIHFEHGKYRVLDPSTKIRYKEDGSDLSCWNDVILVRPPNASGQAREE